MAYHERVIGQHTRRLESIDLYGYNFLNSCLDALCSQHSVEQIMHSVLNEQILNTDFVRLSYKDEYITFDYMNFYNYYSKKVGVDAIINFCMKKHNNKQALSEIYGQIRTKYNIDYPNIIFNETMLDDFLKVKQTALTKLTFFFLDLNEVIGQNEANLFIKLFCHDCLALQPKNEQSYLKILSSLFLGFYYFNNDFEYGIRVGGGTDFNPNLVAEIYGENEYYLTRGPYGMDFISFENGCLGVVVEKQYGVVELITGLRECYKKTISPLESDTFIAAYTLVAKGFGVADKL